MPTDTSEKSLETLIVDSLVNDAGYQKGNSAEYNRTNAIDVPKLYEFLQKTQPEIIEHLGTETDDLKWLSFLGRLQGEIEKRGIIDILRKPIKHGPLTIDLFYGYPTPGNPKAEELYKANIFSITRQLQYSPDETKLALDLCIFINGLPIITFELKNNLTKQTVVDAIQQYKTDRDPRELLFHFGRCMVHFAVDDKEIMMCTKLEGNSSWFLPFNKGHNDGAGNPPNPSGLMTDYLWKEILTKNGLTDIIENYAQIVEEKNEKTGKKKLKQIFPRYHQLSVVHKLLYDAEKSGVGKRYLIQHSAGSGKSNSIAWLSHQLIGLEKDNKVIFDSIIVITDRRVLDKQIKDTIKQYAQVSATVGHSENADDLRRYLTSGKKIIITTVQKFPFVLDEIGDEHRNRHFALIIDEAHSSQGGRSSAKMNIALSEQSKEEEETFEDAINRIMEQRKMLTNASYFAFTATPKNKTLELFGEPFKEGDKIKHKAFHTYTMKQAIEECFILDVLKNYTPVESYYRLIKTVSFDPVYDSKKAKKKLRQYVESHQYAIRQKAEIIVDHFQEQVIARGKIGGKARAMVVTSSIDRAVQYFHEISDYLLTIKSPYKAIIAFSGEHEYGDQKFTEAKFNGFPSSKITDYIQEDPYRFLVVAEKFQTGYDEPLLHTMYVDKPLSGIKAVQTLSRLNRAHPKKHDTFVLDFFNDTNTIKDAFEPYYRTTILSDETDPNKLHDLQSSLESHQVFTWDQVNELVRNYVKDEKRDKIDPILDACVASYKADLNEDAQVDFKGKAKAFVRTYGFLSSILPYTNAEWEKLSVFLNFLISKLPAPIEEDLSKGILDTIDMDSYRVEVQTTIDISLPDKESEIEPVPISGGGRVSEPEIDKLSNIIKTFNDQFGNVNWKDVDKIHKIITEEIPEKVSADKAYQNAVQYSDKQNARIEHDKALQRVMNELIADPSELYKLFSDNPSFKKWLSDTIFSLTYKKKKI